LCPRADDENPFHAGQLLESRFRIVREVARGGMGIVYEAMDERLGRRIALKCAKSEFRKSLPPEVRHASEISHPNVCKIFEIHTASTSEGDVDFLTMEFLEGETLAARLARGPLPEAEARVIARQICAGLAEAHRHRVVHGDLKSNNVILTDSDGAGLRAVITDFGLARKPTEDALPESLGTPDYMAPELWKGETLSATSDVYALGVILFELAEGRRPSSPNDLQGRDPILKRCLQPNPEERFRDAVAVVAAREASSSRRSWRKAAAAVIVAAIGLAAISGVVTYLRTAPSKESIKLVMLPLQSSSDGGTVDLAERISRDAAEQLARLKGGTRAKLSVVPRSEVAGRGVDSVDKAHSVLNATHVIRGTIALENGKVVVQAFLTGADSGEWKAEYGLGEVRYAAMAITGMATAALHLPPLVMSPVNSAAKQNYLAGLTYTHRNSTVDRALPLLESAVAADSDSPLTWAGLAEAQWFKYFISKDPAWLDRASESLRQAQNRNLDLAPVHRVAGLLRANAGFYEQAEAEYLRAIELDPSNADAYRRLGRVYERNHRLDLALAALKKAVEIAPNDFKTYQDLGAYYNRRGKGIEAARQFEKFVQLAPDEPDAHRVLGTAYKDLGRYAEAERELRMAVALTETPNTLVALANALMFQGRDQEAIPFLVRAADQSPDDSLLWMDLGTAYRRTNLPKESERAYRRALEETEKAIARDPRDSGVRSRLAFLSARLGDRKRAETEIAQALTSSPESMDAANTAVWTYEALSKREKTLAILRTSPDDVLLDASRWPDLAELHNDSRFQELLTARKLK
jgi:serine/threonine protein kinase/Flp pilus assembly protein TadD